MQYDDLKLQTPIEISPLPLKVYGNGCLLNNTKPTHFKGKNELRLQGLFFYYQATTNFIAKSMVEINPLLIRQPKSKVKTFDYLTYHDQKKFNHHMIIDKNLFCHNKFGNEKNHCHKIDNKKNLVIIKLTTKVFNRHMNGD